MPGGTLRLDALDAALERHPAVVSVMWVNNEVGSLQPIAEIAARCIAAGVPLHTDGVQAFGKVPVDLRALPISLLTLSGHKIGAPKGIGALVVRDRDARGIDHSRRRTAVRHPPRDRERRGRGGAGLRRPAGRR